MKIESENEISSTVNEERKQETDYLYREFVEKHFQDLIHKRAKEIAKERLRHDLCQLIKRLMESNLLNKGLEETIMIAYELSQEELNKIKDHFQNDVIESEYPSE
ncbi:hypothetical protein bcgnr5390_10030 [Bacillus luti]|nr:hypothetical protein BC2903_30880 [Bacillus cereus]